MKKYITVAALLAAGTAFANAASVVLPEDNDLLFKFDYSSTSDTPQNNTGGWSWTHYGSELPDISDGVATFSNGGPYTDGSVSFDVNNFTIGFDIGNVQNAGGNNINGGVVWSFGISYQQTILFVSVNQTSVALKRWDGDLVTIVEASVDGLTSTDSLVTDIVISNSAAGSFISVGGNLLAQSDSYYSSDVEISSVICIGAVFGGGVEKLNGNLDNVFLYNAAAKVVPEPSAFGLLAGLGALALVASRRRRNRR